MPADVALGRITRQAKGTWGDSIEKAKDDLNVTPGASLDSNEKRGGTVEE